MSPLLTWDACTRTSSVQAVHTVECAQDIGHESHSESQATIYAVIRGQVPDGKHQSPADENKDEYRDDLKTLALLVRADDQNDQHVDQGLL